MEQDGQDEQDEQDERAYRIRPGGSLHCSGDGAAGDAATLAPNGETAPAQAAADRFGPGVDSTDLPGAQRLYSQLQWKCDGVAEGDYALGLPVLTPQYFTVGEYLAGRVHLYLNDARVVWTHCTEPRKPEDAAEKATYQTELRTAGTVHLRPGDLVRVMYAYVLQTDLKPQSGAAGQHSTMTSGPCCWRLRPTWPGLGPRLLFGVRAPRLGLQVLDGRTEEFEASFGGWLRRLISSSSWAIRACTWRMISISLTTRDKGFTLIELLVAIALIAVLAAILRPPLACASEETDMASENPCAWTADSLVKVPRRMPPLPEAREVALDAARGETVSAQVVVTAGAKALRHLSTALEPGTSRYPLPVAALETVLKSGHVAERDLGGARREPRVGSPAGATEDPAEGGC